jgi:hypothetical protein
VLLLLFGAGVAYYLSQHRTESHPLGPNTGRSDFARAFGRQSEVQRDFARVFSMTSAQGKEGVIRRWMERTGCDRTEAMRLAIEEWRRDNR